MSLNVDFLFQAMVRQFHTVPSDDRFQKDFIVACNAVVDEMSFRAELATAIGHITKVNDNISEIDADDGFVLLAGLPAWLIQMGYEHSEGTNAFDRIQPYWERKLNDYQVKISQAEQTTQDSDGVPTADIAGLGYKGDS